MISAADVAQRCKHTTVDCVTVLQTTTKSTGDGETEDVDLRVCGTGAKAYFERVNELGDAEGDVFTEIEAGTGGTPLPVAKLDDYVVVNAAELQQLRDLAMAVWDGASTEGCETPLVVCDMNDLSALRASLTRVKSKPLSQAVRVVRGDLNQESDPVFMVLPPGMPDDDAAIEVVNRAIEQAGKITSDGETGEYFGELRRMLGAHGVALDEDLRPLETHAWDACLFEEEPVEGTPDFEENWQVVTFESSDQEPDEINPDFIGTLADGTEVQLIDGTQQRAFCTSLDVWYPRADRYGVPECATDSGARRYVVQTLGFPCSSEFEVDPEDRGDDGAMTFKVTCVVHRDCLQEVQAMTEAPRP